MDSWTGWGTHKLGGSTFTFVAKNWFLRKAGQVERGVRFAFTSRTVRVAMLEAVRLELTHCLTVAFAHYCRPVVHRCWVLSLVSRPTTHCSHRKWRLAKEERDCMSNKVQISLG